MPDLRTFIVEDSPVIRENLTAALEELVPLKVVGTAQDEAAALAWLRENAERCDLGIFDIFLESGSGLGVLRALRRSSARMKVAMLSNFATPDMRRRCLELGADRVFDKSNELESLIHYCQRLATGAGEGGDSGPASPG